MSRTPPTIFLIDQLSALAACNSRSDYARHLRPERHITNFHDEVAYVPIEKKLGTTDAAVELVEVPGGDLAGRSGDADQTSYLLVYGSALFKQTEA